MNKLIVFVDFDGTITLRDTNEAILVRFTDGERWKVIEEEWVRGNISSQEHFRQHFDLISADLNSLVSYVYNESAIDPAFHDFARYCSERQIELVILSDGFDVFIEAVLSRERVTHIPFICNKLERSDSRWHFTFQQDSRGVDGRDWKQSVVDYHKGLGYRTVCIGDGLSDRAAIMASDIAFVKKGSELDSWCEQQGIACPRFESFKDPLVALRRYRKEDQDE
ncbi:MAG: HAD-IB family phosphatase [Deltaproteobacteria bacterium]|nr:HAD-IB family phosphatase [Deltaproteobacteria bacterium]